MDGRLQQLMDSEGITPARFAEAIGVQRSAISHIISGRNKPSYDLIAKIAVKYPYINIDWLITGRGDMRKTIIQRTIFDELDQSNQINKNSVEPDKKLEEPKQSAINTEVTDVNMQFIGSNSTKKTVKIVVFFDDNTFDEYKPNIK